MLKLAALVPTAVGKSEIAIRIARRMNGEIISCDSMQVYRGMNIGTAKVSPQEQAMVPHHLIDIVDIEHNFTVAEYQSLAQELIDKLTNGTEFRYWLAVPVLLPVSG